jgi:xanthine dehydrogenase YagR molybdenum-binding subunit
MTMAAPVLYDPAESDRLGANPRVVGQPLDRVDGVAKVTAGASYAYEAAAAAGVAYGFIVEAPIARGRIIDIDTRAADAVPGVHFTLTHRNVPAQAPLGPPAVANRLTRARPVLVDAIIRYHGEPVALVVADSFETARAAAALVKVRFAPEAPELDLEAGSARAYKPERVGPGFAPDTSKGDFEAGFAQSDARIDAIYRNGYQNHNPIEPPAALAQWDEDRLTIHASQQHVANACRALAATLQVPAENIRLISRYVGGGFGSKLIINPEVVLAALAARRLRRPVKVAQTRQQMFCQTGHRPAFIQRVRLGADRQGRLLAIGHEVWSQTARFDEFAEQAATPTRSLYEAPHRLTRHRLVPLDLQHGETMRAPGEAPGLLAFESAIDELAVALDLDPLELRLRNEPEIDPERQVPFSSRRLVECLGEGARRFGWSGRPRSPGSRREGRRLIGYGMAAGIRPSKIGQAAARATLRPDGSVLAELDMTDIGTGSYTILTQIVSEVLGIPTSAVTVALGDSRFPATTGSGGSMGAGSSGSALFNACVALGKAVVAAAIGDTRSPLHGRSAGEVRLGDGRLAAGNRWEKLAEIAARHSEGIAGEGAVAPGSTYERFSQHSFAAFFAEVQVDLDTAETRVRRMLGVFDAGRILNEKTARSQLIGGMIWGIGAALHEESVIDPRFGHVVNRDLAGYHVPVHADIGEIEAVLLAGDDESGNPLGSKGIGELGICGSGAAVANAVYNASGVRIRSFPIALEQILQGMPAKPILD